MCIDAPESITNSRSSGLRFDAGRHLFSEGEKNAALFFSFKFRTLCASFDAASRAPCSYHSVSLLRPILKLWSIGVTRRRITWANHSKRWILVSNVSMTYDVFCEFYTSDMVFRMFELFRKIVVDFGDSISWHTQPNCRVFFKKATALLSPFFFTFCWAVHQPGGVHKSTFLQICLHFLTCRTSTLEDATFHRMEWCKFLWGSPCTAVEPFSPLGLLPLGLLVLDAFFTLCCEDDLGDGLGCVDFARLLISWRNLQLSPLEHCPLAFHWPTIS